MKTSKKPAVCWLNTAHPSATVLPSQGDCQRQQLSWAPATGSRQVQTFAAQAYAVDLMKRVPASVAMACGRGLAMVAQPPQQTERVEIFQPTRSAKNMRHVGTLSKSFSKYSHS